MGKFKEIQIENGEQVEMRGLFLEVNDEQAEVIGTAEEYVDENQLKLASECSFI